MFASIIKTWQGLSLFQKISLGVVLALVFGGILWLSRAANRPNYAVLFGNLAAEDAGAVTGKLKERKVDYRLTQGGRSIEVPVDQVHDLRLALATEGLPRGGSTGFELFDKTFFGATDFTQHLNYQRALQGELQRTVNRLDGVLESRIHLALPEKALFSSKEQPPTASVVLHLRPGYELDDRRVAGLVHLVSSAVEGLKPEHVTIHDAHGELLSRGGGSLPVQSNDHHRLQQSYERRLETDLRRLADQVLGPSKAAIRVNAELNWDQSEVTSEQFRPSGAGGRNLPLDEETTTETYGQPDRRIASGVPGMASNMTAPARVAALDNPGQYRNERKNSHFAVSKVVERRVQAPGKIKRLSIAVLLDSKISRGQQESLKEVFAAAAGLDLTPAAEGGRGDRIELLPMVFDKTAAGEALKLATTVEKQQQRATMTRGGASVAIVIVIGIISLLMAKRLLAPRPEPFDALITDTGPMTMGEGSMSPGARHEMTGYGPSGPGHLTGTPTERANQPPGTPTDRIRRAARENPDLVARKLQIWMAE